MNCTNVDEGVFDDEDFVSDDDRLVITITEKMDQIFDMNAAMEIMDEELTAINEPIVKIKPENEVFDLPPEKDKQTTSEEDEPCGEFGILAENQEECWEERRIASGANKPVAIDINENQQSRDGAVPISSGRNQPIRSVGNRAEYGGGTIAVSSVENKEAGSFELPDEIQ